MKRIWMVMVAGLALLARASVYGPSEPVMRLAREAEREFQAGEALRAAGKPAAEEHYAAARVRYEQLWREGDCRNAALFYNLGNACARLGDPGHAVLNYRRALEYDPAAADIRENLRQARQAQPDQLPPPRPNRVLATLFFWHYRYAFFVRVAVAVGALYCFWLIALALVWARPAWLKCAAGAALLLAVGAGSSVAVSEWQARRHPAAVVVAAEAMPRKGAGESYAPALSAPLHAGAEVTLGRRRDGWAEATLSNGARGWLPEGAVETVAE